MNITRNENIRPFDVDGCLIVAKEESTHTVKVWDDVSRAYIKVGVNQAMVRLLHEEKSRGGHIIVWSRSGYAWAAAVVNALNLEAFVDEVKSKPIVYFDNEPVEKWLKDRVFIGPDIRYKK